GDGLADPPCGVGGELEALAVVELLNGAYEADVAFLDEVQEGHATSDVLLRHADDEAEVGFGQALLSLEAVRLEALELVTQEVFTTGHGELGLEVRRQQRVVTDGGGHGAHELRLEDVRNDREEDDAVMRVFLLNFELPGDELQELKLDLGVQ